MGHRGHRRVGYLWQTLDLKILDFADELVGDWVVEWNVRVNGLRATEWQKQ